MLAAPITPLPHVIAATGLRRCRWKILSAPLYTWAAPPPSGRVVAESVASTMPSKTFTATATVTGWTLACPVHPVACQFEGTT